jgi:hypothetical protein
VIYLPKFICPDCNEEYECCQDNNELYEACLASKKGYYCFCDLCFLKANIGFVNSMVELVIRQAKKCKSTLSKLSDKEIDKLLIALSL